MKYRAIIVIVLVTLLVLFPSVLARSFVVYNTSDESHTYFVVNGTTGNVGIGTTIPNQNLVVIGTVNITQGLNVSGGIRVSELASCDTIDTDAYGNFKCGSDADTGGAATVTGGGTAGHISMWNDTQEINASVIYQDSSGNVGIGTTSPNEKLVVIGNTNISGTLNVSGRVAFPNLASCDTIDTDAYGVLSCGSDSSGVSDAAAWTKSNYSAEYAASGFKIANGTALSVGGEASGTVGNIVLAHDALDDQYYDSEADLTGLLDDNYVSRDAWTDIDNYPSACTAGSYVTGLGDTLTCTAADTSTGDDWKLSNFTVAYANEYATSGYKKGNLTTDYPNLDTDKTDDQIEAAAWKIANLTARIPTCTGTDKLTSSDGIAFACAADDAGDSSDSDDWKLSNFTVAYANEYANSGFKIANGTALSVGGEASGTVGNIVLAHDALDDQYYDSEADLTGLLDDNYVSRDAWTDIDNYPSACTAGSYVTGLGDTLTCTAADTSTGDDWKLSNFTVAYANEYATSGYKKGNLTTDYPNLDTDKTDDQIEAAAWKIANLTARIPTCTGTDKLTSSDGIAFACAADDAGDSSDSDDWKLSNFTVAYANEYANSGFKIANGTALAMGGDVGGTVGAATVDDTKCTGNQEYLDGTGNCDTLDVLSDFTDDVGYLTNGTDANFNNLTVINTNTTFGSLNLIQYNASCAGFRFGATGGLLLSCE